MPVPEADDVGYVARLVRTFDRPRYYAALFAPEALRSDLIALYGFAAEIERIPDLVSEPTLGEMRLEFWRDRLEAMAADPTDTSAPALRALSAVLLRSHLRAAPLIALVEARRADLYSDPPATLADLEGILGETQSALFQMAAVTCGAAGPESADAAGHAGVAYGLTRRLAVFAHDRARRRMILPLEVLNETGVNAADLFADEAPAGFLRAIGGLTRHAWEHLRQAEAASAALPWPVRAAFLPLAAAPPLLSRIEAMGADLWRDQPEVSDLDLLFRIAWRRFIGPRPQDLRRRRVALRLPEDDGA